MYLWIYLNFSHALLSFSYRWLYLKPTNLKMMSCSVMQKQQQQQPPTLLNRNLPQGTKPTSQSVRLPTNWPTNQQTNRPRTRNREQYTVNNTPNIPRSLTLPLSGTKQLVRWYVLSRMTWVHVALFSIEYLDLLSLAERQQSIYSFVWVRIVPVRPDASSLVKCKMSVFCYSCLPIKHSCFHLLCSNTHSLFPPAMKR